MTERGRYEGSERRRPSADFAEVLERLDDQDRRLAVLEDELSPEAFERRAATTKESFYNSLFQEVGRNFLRACVWAFGLGGIALIAYLAATGKMKL